jgi:hypothetical protein
VLSVDFVLVIVCDADHVPRSAPAIDKRYLSRGVGLGTPPVGNSETVKVRTRGQLSTDIVDMIST